MIEAWRITKKKPASEAFKGEGARRFGGRWNHKGISVVYASDTISLAALEQFIHLGREGLHISFVYFHIQIPDDIVVSSVERSSLPKDWRKEPPPHSTKDIGTEWAKSNHTAVLSVPSDIVPVGKNYLLNIHHPEFSKLLINDPEPFSFDPRMLK